MRYFPFIYEKWALIGQTKILIMLLLRKEREATHSAVKSIASIRHLVLLSLLFRSLSPIWYHFFHKLLVLQINSTLNESEYSTMSHTLTWSKKIFIIFWELIETIVQIYFHFWPFQKSTTNNNWRNPLIQNAQTLYEQKI